MKIASLNLRMYFNFHIHKLKCIIENEFEGNKQQIMVITCEHVQVYFLFVINSYCYNRFGDE